MGFLGDEISARADNDSRGGEGLTQSRSLSPAGKRIKILIDPRARLGERGEKVARQSHRRTRTFE